MVTEELYSRKLREIEHIYRVSFSHQQKHLWYTWLSGWDEERFVIACKKLLETVEQRWEIRDGNIYAILSTLSKCDARDIAERKIMERNQREFARQLSEHEPVTTQIKDAIQRTLHKLRLL